MRKEVRDAIDRLRDFVSANRTDQPKLCDDVLMVIESAEEADDDDDDDDDELDDDDFEDWDDDNDDEEDAEDIAT